MDFAGADLLHLDVSYRDLFQTEMRPALGVGKIHLI